MTALAVLALLSCGSERVDVKNLVDLDALPDAGSAPLADIAKLGRIPAPQWNPDLPRQPVERHAVTLDAWVLGFKLEADSDYHVVVGDHQGNTLIVEMPDPQCGPVWAAKTFSQVRAGFINLVHRVPERAYRKLESPVPVRVVGVLFFDRCAPGHYPTGHAPQCLELHPVLSVGAR